MRAPLTAAFIFGSVARGQSDALSDIDVLAVVKTGGGKVDERLVSELIPVSLQHLKLSVSWYGEDRLREMWENGELFAWHLSTETIPLFDPGHFLKRLGQPARYYDARKDVISFIKVFSEIGHQLRVSPYNAGYEAGLVYVCARNLAMAASSALCAEPDFSRYSIFALADVPPCPISKAQFEVAMAARMASQRGHEPPTGATAHFVEEMVRELTPWFSEVLTAVERRSNGRH